MIDLHHDLLSIMYYSYLKGDYGYLEEWIKNFNSDNVSGLLANLYFMSLDEMEGELGTRDFNVVEMFEKSVSIFKKYLPDEKVIFSIEGCDYINDTSELEELYNLGLRNILLVWNCPNKYGSGNRGDYGLTDLGREFLTKAIDLGISIDMSHMNKKTFSDTIELIREQKKLGKDVKVIASHSNCFEICHHERNLDDEQLRELKSVDGLLGLVAYGPFVSDSEDDDLSSRYLEHIERAIAILGIDNIGVSTDDMVFAKVLFDEDFGKMVFNYKSVKADLEKLLSQKFNKDEIERIMYRNVENKLF